MPAGRRDPDARRLARGGVALPEPEQAQLINATLVARGFKTKAVNF
jgi:hypothetical protein